MEDFLLVILIIGFIWLFIRQRSMEQRVRSLQELYQRLAQTPSQPQSAPAPVPRPIAVVPAPVAASPVGPQPVAEHRATPPPAYASVTPFTPPPPIELPARVIPTPTPILAYQPIAQPIEPKPRVSIEARLGQNWLNKLGIVILVIGVALLLGRELTTLGPLGKSLIGFALALGILGLGLFLERKPNYRVFARACIGGGWALLFFLCFAIYHLPALQILTSQTADLILMLLVACGMVVHSLKYRSQVVTTLAFLLAFITVGISDVTLFSLVAGALLTGALAFVVYRERWYALGLAGLIGVYTNHFLWLHRVLPDGGLVFKLHNGHAFPEFVPSAILLLSYWLIFRLLYVFRAPLEDEAFQMNQLLSTVGAILNSACLLGLMKYQSSHPEWAFYGLIAIGIAELALSLIARGSDAAKPKSRSAFIVLSTIASVLLLAAIPFRFNGASWPLLWLLEAEAFFLVGIRLPEVVFRRIGIVAAFTTSMYLLINAANALGIDPAASHHLSYVPLFSAAVILWCNAEFMARRVAAMFVHGFDRVALRLSSYIAALLAGLGLTIFLNPASVWLAVAWFLLALALAEVSDRLSSRDLATQSDLLAITVVIRTVALLFRQVPGPHYSLLPTPYLLYFLTALLIYLGMRRKVASWILPALAIAPAYSWIASAFVALLLWYQLEPISVAVAWGVFALLLFELGIVFKRDYLRHQAYALLAAAFVRIFFANLHIPSTTGGLSPSVYTVIPLIAAFAWVYERVHAETTTVRFERIAGAIFAWCGLIAGGTLVYFELRPEWVILAWTVLAIALLALACALKREIFVVQSLAVVMGAALRGIFFHLFSPTPLAGTFVTSRMFTIGLTSALLLLSLPLAFYLRRFFAASSAAQENVLQNTGSSFSALLHRPEQPLFFVPLTLITLLLYVELRGGLITIGWVALGVVTFLFALAVKERSYRLSGLALLLLGVVKILAWDVWHVSATDRYITLIVMGGALLLVSFLYSRYRETLLNFL